MQCLPDFMIQLYKLRSIQETPMVSSVRDSCLLPLPRAAFLNEL